MRFFILWKLAVIITVCITSCGVVCSFKPQRFNVILSVIINKPKLICDCEFRWYRVNRKCRTGKCGTRFILWIELKKKQNWLGILVKRLYYLTLLLLNVFSSLHKCVVCSLSFLVSVLLRINVSLCFWATVSALVCLVCSSILCENYIWFDNSSFCIQLVLITLAATAALTLAYVTFTAALKFCLRLVSPWNSWMMMIIIIINWSLSIALASLILLQCHSKM